MNIIMTLSIILVTLLLTTIVFKRNLYEGLFLSYMILCVMTNGFAFIVPDLLSVITDKIFISIFLFLILGNLCDFSKIMDDLTKGINYLFRKIPGGSALCALFSSTIMGAVSGSGAGNVVTTGTFTIPAMKQQGIPDYLAANIEAQCSTLGNVIPPSGIILLALGCYNAFAGAAMTQGAFWLLSWGVALWFILQRLITIILSTSKYKLKEYKIERNSFSIANSLKAALIPIVIILPIIIDSLLAGSNTTLLLIITPILAIAYIFTLIPQKKEAIINLKNLPWDILLTIGASYLISALCQRTLQLTTIAINLTSVQLCFLIPLFTCLLGMFIPGSAQIKLFGTFLLGLFSQAGGSVLLLALMLPAITGAMEGVTPPLALCTYTATGIAKADKKTTIKNSLIWIALHYAVSVLILLGALPIIGFTYYG